MGSRMINIRNTIDFQLTQSQRSNQKQSRSIHSLPAISKHRTSSPKSPFVLLVLWGPPEVEIVVTLDILDICGHQTTLITWNNQTVLKPYYNTWRVKQDLNRSQWVNLDFFPLKLILCRRNGAAKLEWNGPLVWLPSQHLQQKTAPPLNSCTALWCTLDWNMRHVTLDASTAWAAALAAWQRSQAERANERCGCHVRVTCVTCVVSIFEHCWCSATPLRQLGRLPWQLHLQQPSPGRCGAKERQGGMTSFINFAFYSTSKILLLSSFFFYFLSGQNFAGVQMCWHHFNIRPIVCGHVHLHEETECVLSSTQRNTKTTSMQHTHTHAQFIHACKLYITHITTWHHVKATYSH